MRKLLYLSIFIFGLVHGQNFVATQTFILSTSSGVMTIQQPPTVSKAVKFAAVEVESDTDISFTLERDGGGATTTAFAPVALNKSDGPPTMIGYNNSNAGTGLAMGHYLLPAGGYKVIDLSKIQFLQSQSGRNLTIRTGPATGNVVITITWLEQQQS